MKTLVTGAGGLVGNNVVRQLLDDGHAVRVLMRPQNDLRALAGLDVEIALGDIRDRKAVLAACQGIDTVVHAAARVHFGWSQLDEMREVNVTGTRHVAQAARGAGARLIHVSSVDALGIRSRMEPADEETPREGNLDCSYVVTKREAEQAVQEEIESGLDAVIVNPGFMLGPWDWKPSSGRMLLAVATRFVPFTPSGGFSVCDVRDVATAILAAIERGRCGRNYILAGTNMTYYDTWCLFAEVANRRKPLHHLGPLNTWLVGHGGDLIGKLTGREPDVNSAGMRMASLYHYYTSRRAEQELGYQTRPPRESVEASWQWLQENGYT